MLAGDFPCFFSAPGQDQMQRGWLRTDYRDSGRAKKHMTLERLTVGETLTKDKQRHENMCHYSWQVWVVISVISDVWTPRCFRPSMILVYWKSIWTWIIKIVTLKVVRLDMSSCFCSFRECLDWNVLITCRVTETFTPSREYLCEVTLSLIWAHFTLANLLCGAVIISLKICIWT